MKIRMTIRIPVEVDVRDDIVKPGTTAEALAQDVEDALRAAERWGRLIPTITALLTELRETLGDIASTSLSPAAKWEVEVESTHPEEAS